MVTAAQHMAVAGHYLAAQAAFEILEAGGNAIDAGVAGGIALGVLHSDQVQVSGVAPIILRLAESNEVLTISGLGWWPEAATLDAVMSDTNDPHVPLGLKRTVVPAAPDAWILALNRFGTMGFAEVAKAATRFAREGFTMHPHMTRFITNAEENYRRWPDNAAIWLPNGRVPQPGELFVQSDLARSLQFMIDEDLAARAKGGRAAGLAAARHAFYEGDLAREMVAFHEANGGLLRMRDLARYRSAIEPAVRYVFGDLEVNTCGPWCQGPVLAQMLAILDGADLTDLGHNSLDYIHLVAEAMKLALADRERYYGDPRHVDVPIAGLVDRDYGAARRGEIRPDSAWSEMPPAGLPAGAGWAGADFPLPEPSTGLGPAPADTSYVCAVDAQGNVFSATPSDVSFQSPVIPGLGFCPSARGSQSRGVPDHPCSVAPGRRPRLTPNPALALRRDGDGKPVFAMPFGAPGGDAQAQGMLQVLLNHVEFGMDLQDAVEAPRFISQSHPDSFAPHAYYPGRLIVEGRIPQTVTDDLSSRGHDIVRLDDVSHRVACVLAIAADLESGLMSSGADPRRPSRAVGF